MQDKNLYISTAHLYDDSIKHTMGNIDIPFYKSYLTENSEVLEIACGTGRVSIELARFGCNVTGIDISKPMLEIFHQKLTDVPAEIYRKVRIVEADMRSFTFKNKFDLIIYPCKSFHALTTDNGRILCLNSVRGHMKPKSRVIITMFNPDPEKLRPRGAKLDYEYIDDSGCTIRRYSVIEGHARTKQITFSHHKFEISKDDKIIQELTERFELGYLYLEQAKNLFEKNHLRIVDLYADYDRSPINPDQKKELIYVLQQK